jgi:hypothetical protein
MGIDKNKLAYEMIKKAATEYDAAKSRSVLRSVCYLLNPKEIEETKNNWNFGAYSEIGWYALDIYRGMLTAQGEDEERDGQYGFYVRAKDGHEAGEFLTHTDVNSIGEAIVGGKEIMDAVWQRESTSYQECSDMGLTLAAVVLNDHVVDFDELFRTLHAKTFNADVRDKFADSARHMLLAESANLLYRVGELAPEVLLTADRLSDDGITEETYKYAHEIVSMYLDERKIYDDTKCAMHYFCSFLYDLLDPRANDKLHHRHITDAVKAAAKIALHKAGYNAARAASDEAIDDSIDEYNPIYKDGYFEAIEKMCAAEYEAVRLAAHLIEKLHKLWNSL